MSPISYLYHVIVVFILYFSNFSNGSFLLDLNEELNPVHYVHDQVHAFPDITSGNYFQRRTAMETAIIEAARKFSNKTADDIQKERFEKWIDRFINKGNKKLTQLIARRFKYSYQQNLLPETTIRKLYSRLRLSGKFKKMEVLERFVSRLERSFNINE